MNAIRFLLLLIMLSSQAFAFNRKADSLKSLIRTTKATADNVSIMLDFCEENRSYSYDTLKRYADLASALSKAINNPELEAKAAYFEALNEYRRNNLSQVSIIVNPLLAAEAKHKRKGMLSNRFKLLKASTYLKQSNHKAAVDMFYQVIADAEQSGDTASYIRGLNGQGWVLMELEQFEAAKKWFHKGLQAARYSPDSLKTAILYANMASSCGGLGQLDSARQYVETAIAMARLHDDLPVQANSLNILASYYIDKLAYDKALTCVNESAEIRKKIGDPFFIISDMAQQSYLLAKTGRPAEAMSIIDKAISYATEHKLESKLPMLYLVRSQNLYDNKDYKGSADALFMLEKMQDSLYRKASAQALAEMQVRYETAQQEQTIQAQQYELSRQNYMVYGSLTCSMLVVLLAFAIVRNRQHKQAVKLQKMILQQQDQAAKSIVVAEENERKRIASDLHDGLGQMLTAARFNLSGIAGSMHVLPLAEQEVFHKAVGLLDDSCMEVRNVSHNIMPNALIDSGLSNAIRDFTEKIKSRQLQIELSTSGLNEHIDDNTVIMVYRIVQECVHNTVKHSGATKLDISLINDEDGLHLTLEDNGKGFDPARLVRAKGIGMKNIRTRTRYLKGTIDIDSRPGKGTLIAIHIPTKNKQT